MNAAITPLDGGLLRVPGLRGAAATTGVKPSGKSDLALIVADEPWSAAGMFTTCEVAAAPVELCRHVLTEHDTVRSVVVNSGNANALTGPDGALHAMAMREAVEAQHRGPALVLSTGVIGVPLPIDKVLGGIREASGSLSDDHDADDADSAIARAILTTDTTDKRAAVQVRLGDRTVTVGGVAKGSGMIHPNMATMLAVLATDAPVSTAELRDMLPVVVDHSFHQISVDGDTSTNDAVVLLAPPAEGSLPLDDRKALQDGLIEVARRLAEAIIEDGEGRTRTLEIHVTRAASAPDARAVARSIATSNLVKTALAGGDPNWGRILAAAGNAGVVVDPRDLTLTIAGTAVFAAGAPQPVDPGPLNEAFSADRVCIELDLDAGSARARLLTTDLSHRYVEINAEYTT